MVSQELLVVPFNHLPSLTSAAEHKLLPGTWEPQKRMSCQASVATRQGPGLPVSCPAREVPGAALSGMVPTRKPQQGWLLKMKIPRPHPRRPKSEP